MNIIFKHFQSTDYQSVCDFFLENTNESNWNWARWEWMYYHPYFDIGKENSIGLWKDGERVVGLAVYDLYYGEAFCDTLPSYQELLPEVVQYAYDTFRDENGLGIYAQGVKVAVLEKMGFALEEEQETMSELIFTEELPYTLPADLSIRHLHFPDDNLAYQKVIWKGFDHDGDDTELQKMLDNSQRIPQNRDETLCLSVEDGNGEFVAHCTCWYNPKTDYAYVEPVCVIPAFRGRGLGKAVVSEALNRCKKLGAKRAIVLSDLGFYQSLGFRPIHKYNLYCKKE